MTEISEILYRWVNGVKIKAISRSLGVARNTIRSLIRRGLESGLKVGDDSRKVDEISANIRVERYKVKEKEDWSEQKLIIYEGEIKEWLGEENITIKQIWRLISERGVKISESSVRRYINKRILVRKNATIHITTKAGEEGQVDYGNAGLMVDPKTKKLRKAYIFIMTLSHSRMRYVEYVFKQDERSWIQSHINAFNYYGGVPQRIVLDNLKSGVISADIYDPTINKSYAELERYYGFIADPTKVRQPQHKGKIERSVLIVKQQLLAGRKYKDIEEANEKAKAWCRNIIANQVTRTTGKTPKEIYEKEEKAALKYLPKGVFDIPEWEKAKVHRDHHVVFRGNFYSVPTTYIGNEVWVRGGLRVVEIYCNHKIIKSHIREHEKGKWVTDVEDYPESVKKFIQKTPEKCLEEAESIGLNTLEVIKEVLSDISNQRLRKAQAILRLREHFSADRLEKACKRAYSYKCYSYKNIKNMLEKGMEAKAIEEEFSIAKLNNPQGSYVRSAQEFSTTMEVHHG
ncbi:IS21 family transposase [Candidatus Jidaibacter acanthamoebae]|nr:IS21 family transposase [Candidatus Jidaibacter acanthamoeba]